MLRIVPTMDNSVNGRPTTDAATDFEAGIRVVSWDGRNDAGLATAPGVCLAVPRAPGRVLRARFTLLH